MLPGFRFLFAAIVLAISMLICGLGAAALLRAAHEEFVSMPSRRAPPEIMFAQPNDSEPTLAILRVEPEKIATPTPDDMPVAASPQEQPAITAKAPEPEKSAAEPDPAAALTNVATAEDSSPSETPKSEAAAPENPVQTETPARTDAPSPAVETKTAAIAETPPIAPNPAAVTVQATAPVEDGTRIAETKIATLGGPPVTIETNTPAKLAPATVKKSVHARRTVKRRRIAQRARVARPAPQQQPANPFGKPFGS